MQNSNCVMNHGYLFGKHYRESGYKKSCDQHRDRGITRLFLSTIALCNFLCKPADCLLKDGHDALGSGHCVDYVLVVDCQVRTITPKQYVIETSHTYTRGSLCRVDDLVRFRKILLH